MMEEKVYVFPVQVIEREETSLEMDAERAFNNLEENILKLDEIDKRLDIYRDARKESIKQMQEVEGEGKELIRAVSEGLSILMNSEIERRKGYFAEIQEAQKYEQRLRLNNYQKVQQELNVERNK